MSTFVSTLLPLFILPLLGFLANFLHILPKDTGDRLCSLLYLFCVPATAFFNIINSKIEEIFNFRYALATLTYELFVFFLLSIIYKKIYNTQGTKTIIHAMCSFYGNVLYVGIPVFLSLFNNIIPNTITNLIHVLFVLPFIYCLLDNYSKEKNQTNLKSIIIKTIRIATHNPNIIIPIVGALLLLVKIKVPNVILSSIELLGKPTTSMGLFALGFNSYQTMNNYKTPPIFKESIICALSKTILCPVIAFIVGKYIFSLDRWWLSALIVMAMLPSALNCYIISQQYHSDENCAKLSVLLSTLFFSVTISLYIMFIGI